MITETAILNIKTELASTFENDFRKASLLIARQKGYINHWLKKCIEYDNQYLLIVNWETLEDHEIGLRQSDDYQEWKSILHHYYDPFPEVLHFEEVKL